MVVYARAALTRRRRGPGGVGLLSAAAATAQQELFPHVFQLYGGFLLRALALLVVLASRRAATRSCFLVSYWTLANSAARRRSARLLAVVPCDCFYHQS